VNIQGGISFINMVKVNKHLLMVQLMMEIGIIIKFMDLENILGMINDSIKDNGKLIKWMELAFLNGLMVKYI